MRIIIVGGNKTVYYLTRQFIRKHYHVTIINRDPHECHELAAGTRATVVLGDGTHVNRLDEAGAREADVLLALTAHDQDNLIACQVARRNFGVPRTIATVNDPDNERVFQELGIDVAFSATRVLGSLIEQETVFDEITELMPLAKGRINLTNIHLDRDAPSVGKTLIELDLTRDSLVACIIRDDDVIVPRGNTRLLVNDQLILISHPDKQQRDLEILCGAHG